MPEHLETAFITCPYCGEEIEVLVDCSSGTQQYIEDCQVCCAPIEFSVLISPYGAIEEIRAQRDSD